MPSISIAKTLTGLNTNPYMTEILNKGSDLSALADEVLSWWTYDMYTRKPSKVFSSEGIFEGTTLDMACILSGCVDRGAVINIPKYVLTRESTVTEGEHVVSKNNRHGKMTGLYGNKNNFTFGVSMIDMNVMSSEDVGKPRKFSLTDMMGGWNEGWHSLEFIPTAKENDFLNDKDLWQGNTITCKSFIHPNRWIAFYGQHYAITKALLDRLTAEAAHYNSEVKRLEKAGIEFPEGYKTEWGKSYVAVEGVSIKVPSNLVELDYNEYTGEFPTVEESVEGLVDAYERRKRLTYDINQRLTFIVRATEWAYYDMLKKKSSNGETVEPFPSWISGVEWEQGWKKTPRSAAWDRLELMDENQDGFSIRKRTVSKSEKVSDSYAEQLIKNYPEVTYK